MVRRLCVILTLTVGATASAFAQDKRVKEGDRVGGFTVSEILPNKVYLDRSGERITLSVFQPLTELKSGAEQ